jgi:hypothetical protein
LFFIYTPQLEQLVAVQPAQEEAPAERLTVSPPPPLLTNPHADIRRFTFALPQSGQTGRSFAMTIISNRWLHFSHVYS